MSQETILSLIILGFIWTIIIILLSIIFHLKNKKYTYIAQKDNTKTKKTNK